MILTEKDIKSILDKKPRPLKNKLTNEIVNEYSYTEKENLDLIQTYIYSLKGVDVGQIESPKGELCPSFIKIMAQNGISGISAMQNASDFNAMSLAFDISLSYFNKKFKNEKNN